MKSLNVHYHLLMDIRVSDNLKSANVRISYEQVKKKYKTTIR